MPSLPAITAPWDRGRWGRHRDRGVDAGDILTGVLILGGIAAVASAVSKNNDRTRSYPDTRPYPDQPRAYRTNANGIDGAVDMCVREVERNARVAQVDRVERDASGWLVTGALAAGGGFSCSIGSDGRIERLDTNLPGGTYGSDDRQYGDDAYYSARARLDGAPPADAQPAYPGGPLPGDPVYDDLPGG